MKEALGPSLRAASLTAFVAGVAYLLLDPPSLDGLVGLIVIVAGALAIVLVTAWVTVTLIGRRDPRGGVPAARGTAASELAATPPPDFPPTEFDLLVMQGARRPPRSSSVSCCVDTPVIVSNSRPRAPAPTATSMGRHDRP